MSNHSLHYMHYALSLAKRVQGQTAPNPAVGCVIVKEGQIVGTGHTAPGGRPHAETKAIEQAGHHTQGATAYVTLEPCAHQGKTGPCTQAIIEAGIAEVYVACIDPDSRTSGKGIKQLQAAGIKVHIGLAKEKIMPINEGFMKRIQKNIPQYDLKIATSADGYITYADGTSKWITGEAARHIGHRLRSEYDIILTGIGTVIADDPQLTCRLPGLEKTSPIRAVMDSNLRISPDSQLVRTAKQTPLILFTKEKKQKTKTLETLGVQIITLPEMTLETTGHALAKLGYNRVLIEAGQKLSTHALDSKLLSTLYWFRAPKIIGEKGLAAFTSSATQKLILKETRQLGEDQLQIYQCNMNEERT